jgi:ferredoxin
MQKNLKIIDGSTIADKASVRLPGSVPPPALFRGAVTLDAEKCIGCGMCFDACVSNAITGSDQADWAYEPGLCTFCGRCVESCPAEALSMDIDTVPCPECGDPVRWVGDDFIERAFDHVKEETRELLRLCERCRRRRLQRNMMTSAFMDNTRKTR